MYQIKKYQGQFDRWDSDTRKRFDMVKRLSKNFTIENNTALELDKALTEQIELEDEGNSNKVKPSASVERLAKSGNGKSDKFKAIEESFTELFRELKTRSSGNIDPEAFKEVLSKALKDHKIGFEQLDEEVQQKLSVQPQIIKYDIPQIQTLQFEKPPIKTFQAIIDDVMMGNNVMLIGGAGTGKTFLAENLVSKTALGREYLTINCSQWTSPTEIIGGQTMDGYVEGKLIEAWSKGYVLILDELPKIDPNTAGLFNDALAKTKVKNSVIFNSRRESFTKHDNFACIATGNIYPNNESIAYGANNKQDLSLLDRFSGSVYYIEKNPEIERKILQNDMIWSICDMLRSGIEEYRYEAQLSLRFMMNARDCYNLEMQRSKEKGKNGVKANEGKTFKQAVDNFLSTFTEVQQKNLKGKVRYDDIFKNYDYREFDKTKMIF